ncbi:MAG: translocation/assembly module TamB domain-containing protein [Candidatus Thiodiazotropha sp.]
MSGIGVKRVAKTLSLSLLLLLLLFCSMLYYLIYTHDGSRRLYHLAQRLAPGDLQVDSFQGRLAGPLELSGLVYRQGNGLGFRSQRIYLDWHPVRLLGLQLDIAELAFTESRLQLPAAAEAPDEDAADASFEGLRLPLEVRLGNLSSGGFELLRGEEGDPLRIDRLRLSAATRAGALAITEFEAEGFSSSLSLQGSLGLGALLPMAIDLAWSHSLDDGPRLAGEGRLSGDLKRLRLEQRLAPPVAGRLELLLSDLLDAAEWRAELDLEQAELAPFVEAFPASLTARLQAGGSFETVDLGGELRLAESRVGELKADIEAAYDRGAVRLEGLQLSNSQGLDLQAKGAYLPAQGELSADLDWRGLRWPLTADAPDISSDSGRLQLQGQLDDYRYQLSMLASRAEVGAVQLDATGQGSLERVDLDALSIGLQQGRIEGDGRLVWSPELSWEMALTGEGVDPAFVQPMFPGNLAFDLNTRGVLGEAGADALFQLERLSGSLRDYPLSGKGQLTLRQGELTLQALELVSGDNRIEADGSLGERLAMRWSVDAPQLDSLWPGLSGALEADGALGGTLQAPSLQAGLKADGLKLEDYRIAELKAEVDLEMAAQQPVAVALQAEGLSAFGRAWQSLTVDIQGRIPQHRLQLDLVGEQVPELSLAGLSGLGEGGGWQGELQRLRLVSPETGAWQLESAMAYRLQGAEYALAPFCLVAGEARICGELDARAGAWEGGVAANRLPLALLQPLLPDETRIDGVAELEADFSVDTAGAIRARAELQVPRGGFDFPLGGGQEQVDFSASRATAILDPAGLRAEAKLPLQQLGGFDLQLRLPGIDPRHLNLEQQPLEGRVKGGIDDLAMLTALSPQLQNSRGGLNLDLSMEGSLAAPRVKGGATLDQGAVDIPQLGIELRDIDLRLETSDLETLNLKASLRSGKGRLSLSGTTRLDAQNGFPSSYKIEGEAWTLVDVPEAEVALSPDLSFEHSASKSLLQGRLHIPFARIRPRTLPESAVSGSSDLVVVGDEETEQEQPDTPLHAEIHLSLGKRVSFDGFGLRGKFNGGLMIIDEPGRPVVGRGRLGITDGVYQAYGQDLKIERGYALFADSPVDNPGLDVRAVREIDEITAGIRITGTMKKPKLKLFSTPSMAESDILSYIVTGRPGGESSGKTAGVLAVMQATGASSVATELGRQLGLEELRVETGSSLEEAALVAGTYLSPRLYVQYVNELATSETKIRMRYDLTDRWQLEAETGRTQSGDFFYTFDR